MAQGIDKDGTLIPGSWALQFGVYSDLTLRSFDNAHVAVQRQLSKTSALRANLYIGVDSSDRTASYVYPDTTRDPAMRKDDKSDVRVALNWVHISPRPGEVKWFFGGGPFFQRAHREYTQSQGSDFRRDSSNQTAYGVEALLGAAWYFAENFSLHAEYGLALGWMSSTSKIRREDAADAADGAGYTYKDDLDGWSLSGRSVLFGLTVYF